MHARIIAVADAYDAMTTNRTYEKAYKYGREGEGVVKGYYSKVEMTYALTESSDEITKEKETEKFLNEYFDLL